MLYLFMYRNSLSVEFRNQHREQEFSLQWDILCKGVVIRKGRKEGRLSLFCVLPGPCETVAKLVNAVSGVVMHAKRSEQSLGKFSIEC